MKGVNCNDKDLGEKYQKNITQSGAVHAPTPLGPNKCKSHE